MLRVAIPYGTLSSPQLRALAHVARHYDRGYGHFTTRQNIQFNWIELEQVGDILEHLAGAQMHAIQTSGNCVRNITTEAFAGVAADEWTDPRPLAEILRQWSTVNPEFLFLPRKFKIALSSAVEDRAAVQMHDIGLYLYRHPDAGELRLRVLVGGGLGRTPMLGQVIRDDLPWQHLLSYVEAILRVYNRYGRRDNKYKARIKILVKALTPEVFAERVEAEWANLKDGPSTLTEAEVQRVAAHFVDPAYKALDDLDESLARLDAEHPGFARWRARNTFAHKKPGYVAVTLSLKPTGTAPGDVTDKQLEAIADLADRYSFGEVRNSHNQNIILADVEQGELFALWGELRELGFATPNVGLLTDIICCPGGDFCSLANAKSIPIAQGIQQCFEDLDHLHDIGELSLNISGCMNACGHHHIGNIGILGVDKNGSEWYQVTLGGAQGKDSALGKVIGPSFSAAEVPAVIERIVETFTDLRVGPERFIDTFNRVGLEPFKARVYARMEEPA